MSSTRRPLAAERRQIARRATCLQAVWNYETRQGVGFAWAIAPGLDRLYPDPRARGERILAHLEPFNSNPYLATIGIGFALRLEQEVARGSAGADHRLSRLIKALRSSLGALGDDLFWAAWRPTLGVIGAAVALATGSPIAALVYWIAYNALAQTVRWRGVRAGFASGAGIARVLQDPFWSRASGITKTAGAAASGAVVGGALWAASGGGLEGISVFLIITAFLWLAGWRRGSRGRWLSPSVAFLVVVILLSVMVPGFRGGSTVTSEVHEAEVEIQNHLGLHARPAAQFVRLSNRFGSDIFLSKNGVEVNAKSIMGVMMLAAERGARVQIRAVGPDANEAIRDLVALIERRFDEDDEGQPVDAGPSSAN